MMKRFSIVCMGLLWSNLTYGLQYYGQYGQDVYLNEQVFGGKREGVFVDVGANDPIFGSNTYFFEKEMGWRGICIEPLQHFFDQLTQVRLNSICLQTCVSSIEGEIDFLHCTGYPTNLSGLLHTYDPRHMQRVDQEIAWYGGAKEIIKIKTRRLGDILAEHNITHIDLLSIDTEGSEEDILRSMDFEKVSVDVIIVENNYSTSEVKEYLESQGYELIGHVVIDDIYRKKVQ